MRHFSFGTIVMMVAMMIPFIAKAQLAGGTYTINSAVATGGTNYISFGAAMTAMASGITGPVVFNVVAGSGPYTEQVTIGSITGTSATNTIKFNGNGATVQYTATTTYQGVLMLNGAKFVKIDSLTFKTLSATYGFGANIYNTSTSDTITRCIFDVTSTTSTASANTQGVRIASTATSTSTAASGANNLYFANNKILGGTGTGGPYYGLYVYGTSTNCVFEKNLITNFYYAGAYMYYLSTNNKFSDNEINRATKTLLTYCYGIYGYYIGGGFKCERNKIHTLGGTAPPSTYCYPMMFGYHSATAASPNLIANNIVYNMNLVATYGIYAYNCAFTNFYHNSVTLNLPNPYGGTQYGFYLSTTGNTEFKNNVASITSGGTYYKYGMYLPNGWSGPALSRNVINVNSTQAGTQVPYSFSYTDYPSLATFQAAAVGQEVGSVNVDPMFVNVATGDLHPTNTAMFAKGVNLQTVVPTDFIGQTRLAAPAAGAFEFQANGTNNAGVVGLVEPLGRYCPGAVPVKVTIYNAGTNNITTVKVNWSLNGVLQTPTTYTTTTLTPLTGATPLATITLGNAPLTAGVPVGLKIWTSLPNNGTDALNANDTLSDSLRAVKLSVHAVKDTICLNRGAIIALTPTSGYTTGGLQWESSTNGGAMWTPILSSDVTTLVTPNLSTNTWFRTKLTSAPNTCYSDTSKIYTTNPQLLSNTPDTSRCGPGTMTLAATSSANSQLKWFNSASSTLPVATGSVFVTPYLGADADFWVSAGIPNAQPEPTNVVQGTSTTYLGSYMPFYYSYANTKIQYIVSAQEMASQGYNAGYINALGFKVTTVGTAVVQNINISLKATTNTVMTVFETTGMTSVYDAATYTLQPNATNMFQFQTPFYWDGFSNIVVSVCKNNNLQSSGTTFMARYVSGPYTEAYGYSATVNQCTSASPVSTYYYRPETIMSMTSACETAKKKIHVTVYPVPVVDLGPDINKCVDPGYAEVLDAGVQPNTPQFLWDNNTTSQVRAVSESGTYNVKVKNQFGCANSDTVNVILRNNPVVHLGNDTTVCNGVVLNLNPGTTGIEYFWNTGQTTQNINISAPGAYSVFVTNNQGCTKADTIVITMDGELPSIQGINVSNNGQYTFHFTAVNPENVIGYDWDFGDGSAHSYQASPIHTYPDAGNYIVVLHLSSSCGFFSDSTSAHILGINQLNVGKDEMTVYPNPTKATATILNRGALKMENIAVYNVFGQVIYKAKADSKDKHSLNLGGFASGIYTIQIFTDKGTVARKLEIIK